MRDLGPTWKESLSFEQWVIKMIEEKRTGEPEFQAMLNIPGYREKMRKIYDEWKEEKKR